MRVITLSLASCLLASLLAATSQAASVPTANQVLGGLALPPAKPAASTAGDGPRIKDPRFITLYTFTGGADGASPESGVVFGAHGSLLGTSAFGGTFGTGTAFQLTPPASDGDAWAFSLVHSFTGGADGGLPDRLLPDTAGNLFGEAVAGGTGACQLGPIAGCGLVFELSPPKKGQTAWTETVIYNFAGGADGQSPQDGLVQDAQGDLFGSTLQTGTCFPDQCGTVFKLTPPAHGETRWTKTTLWTFNSEAGGGGPVSTMLLDPSGRLFGVLIGGGYLGNQACKANQFGGCGAIFMLTPPSVAGGTWKEKTLWRFSGADGIYPYADLKLDANGTLYGLANYGGNADYCAAAYGCGTLYKLMPPVDSQNGWSLSTPWKFTGGTDGAYPLGAGLLPYFDSYVTTTSGDEASTFGSIDLFMPSSGKKGWKEKTLFSFTNDANGENPATPLIERNGTFYGETAGGAGPVGYGTIYSFRP